MHTVTTSHGTNLDSNTNPNPNPNLNPNPNADPNPNPHPDHIHFTREVGSGIPELKSRLNGVAFPRLLKGKTYLVKAFPPSLITTLTLTMTNPPWLGQVISTIFAVSSCLPIGKALAQFGIRMKPLASGPNPNPNLKEGPMIHCGACVASICCTGRKRSEFAIEAPLHALL